MKRGFVRTLWGVYDDSNRISNRRFRVKRNVESVLSDKYVVPFRTYVLGEENYNELKSAGVKDVVLVDTNPFRFNIARHQYRNKIELIMQAMEDYDEIVYMDWDVKQRREFNVDKMWNDFSKRAPFQACLQQYHRKKCPWRKDDIRKVPNGGFIYIRDKKIVHDAADWWLKLNKQDNDEPSWARVSDEIMGGWKGMEAFWNNYENMYCNLRGTSPFDAKRLRSKHAPFIHFQGGL